MRKHRASKRAKSSERAWIKWLRLAGLMVLSWYVCCGLVLVLLRFAAPITTTVHIQRRVESWFGKGKYQKRSEFVALHRIAPDLRHAVIAAEDGRFYDHQGVDFEEMKKVYEDSVERGKRLRGGSTISQQLVKNLFLTTHRSPVRKALEYALVPLAELILPKERILELYLNIIEWGPGVYGAQAAAKYHYGASAARLSREQAARLAAVIPDPLRRRPSRMNEYSAEIQRRMARMGW
ncbi:MAG: monofunctional biosynthetic peptidoglycan transglycosylase [Acidimicrobiia bacterium]|nr:monofunctional biosynthetic peptidoglycan transglycosylase [Acidimicrobiia bacterium]